MIFVFCRAIMPFGTVGNANLYKEKPNFFMRTALYAVFSFVIFESLNQNSELLELSANASEGLLVPCHHGVSVHFSREIGELCYA